MFDLRHDHGVDDVNDAIGRFDVSFGDGCIVDGDAVRGVNGNRRALNGYRFKRLAGDVG